jgi:mono/diheme cytochrome c family protein
MRTVLVTLSLISLYVATASAADANAGKAVYDRACKSCHGPDGTANPAIAKMMKVEIQDLKSPDVQSTSNDEMKKIITEGKGKMRAMPSISGADLDNVVAYVYSLKKSRQ